MQLWSFQLSPPNTLFFLQNLNSPNNHHYIIITHRKYCDHIFIILKMHWVTTMMLYTWFLGKLIELFGVHFLLKTKGLRNMRANNFCMTLALFALKDSRGGLYRRLKRHPVALGPDYRYNRNALKNLLLLLVKIRFNI